MKKIAIFTAFAALVSFSSCEEDSLSGCTNPDVINYNAAATEDDGSCEYERNSITVEDPNGVYRSFDIINCDEENLILRVKFYSRDPGLEGLVVIRTFTCTR